MSVLKSFLEANDKNGAASLILRFSPFVQNFKSRVKGDLKNTLIASHSLSSSFGFDIVNGDPVIGIPSVFFEDFIHVRWSAARVVPGKSGLYLVFKTSKELSDKTMAIKLIMSKDKGSILLEKRNVIFVKMLSNGTYDKPSRDNSFRLPVFELSKLEWE